MKTRDKEKIDNNIQPRFFEGATIQIEERADGEPSRKVFGYAAVFNKWSKPLGYGGWFREKIDPMAFNAVLQQDTVAVFNHDNNLILARNKKTLKLSVDSIGLRYEFEAPNSPNGENLLEAIRRGDIAGSSFRFMPKATKWELSEEDGIEEDRTIIEVEQLIDVGPVTFPAYPDATAEADKRDYENYCKEHRKNFDDTDREQTPSLDIYEQELKLYKL